MIYFVTIFETIGFILIALIIGYKIARLARVSDELSAGERIVFSFAFGAALISFLIFFLGLSNCLYLVAAAAVILIPALLSLKEIPLLLDDLHSTYRAAILFFRNKFFKPILLFLLIVIVITFIGALAPIKGNEALIYHLPITKYFAQNHSINPVPYTARSLWPFFMHMFFVLSFLVNNMLLAKMFNFTMAIFCAGGLYFFGKRFMNREVGFLAMALFFITPGLYTQATYANVDIGWTFFTFLSLYSILLWNSSKNKRWLIISAITSGICADIKYTGLVIPFLIVISIVFLAIREKKRGHILGSIILFSLISGVVMLPYYIRLLIYEGNLFYPLYVKYIGESGWYDLGMICVVREFIPLAKKNFLNFILLPWRLTYFPQRIFSGGESQLGPIYLAFLPGIFFIKRPYSVIWPLILFTVGFFTLWFFAFPAIRFVLPIIPLLALLLGYIVWDICYERKRFGRIGSIMFNIFLMINLLFCFYYNREELGFFGKKANADQYLIEQDRSFKVFQYINENTPLGSKIMLVGEVRSLYLNRQYVDEEMYRIDERYDLGTVDEIIPDLKSLGITHILYIESRGSGRSSIKIEFSENTLPDLLSNKSFVDKYLDEIFTCEYAHKSSQNIKYKLYKLRS
ncbi:ArnT family glycosyltransferase [Candidatus Omnitrophota bacterium]